jgi:hypothetical protein
MVPGDHTAGSRPTPGIFQQLHGYLVSHAGHAHQDPRVRPIVISQEEGARIRLEKEVPVEEVDPHRDGIAVLLQAGK